MVLSHIAISSVANILIKFINLALSFLVGVVLARNVSPSEFGSYSYVLAVISLLIIPCQFGFPVLMTREVARADGRPEYLSVLVHWAISRVALIASLVWALAVFFVFTLFDDTAVGHLGFIVFFIFLLIPIQALTHLASGVMRGVRSSVTGELANQIIRPTFFMLFLLVFFYLDDGSASFENALILNVSAAICAAGIAYTLLFRKLYSVGLRKEHLKRSTTESMPSWKNSILPLALVGGLVTFNKQVDLVILGIFVPDEEIGFYQVAVRGAGLVSVVLLSVNLVTSPLMAKLHAAQKQEELQTLLTNVSRIVTCISSIFGLVLIVFGSELITLVFGDAYSSAATPLAILCVGMLINSATGPVIALLNMTGFEKGTLRGASLAAASNIILNLILVPKWGMNGAATATASTFLIWNAYLWKYSRVHLGVDTSFLGLAAISSKGSH